MSAEATLEQTATPAAETQAVRAQLEEIDQSLKWPTLVFLVCALFWLLKATGWAMITAFKSVHPEFFSTFFGCAWMAEAMTYGRFRAGFLNAIVYGWGANSAFAVGLWIMARLSRTPTRNSGLLLTAGIFWNVAVLVGICGIFFGDLTSVELLEMPAYVSPLLLVSFGLVGVWTAVDFYYRQSEHIFASQWFLLGAIFWFPWCFTAVQVTIFFLPAPSTVQSIAGAWYAHNVIALWLGPVGLGAAYYLIPKVLGKPLHSYYLAVLAFWTYAIVYGWAGVSRLAGGPVPVWVPSVGIAAAILMLIPAIITSFNLNATIWGRFKEVAKSPTLSFVVFGSKAFVLFLLISAFTSLRSVAEITQFTLFMEGVRYTGLYAFFSMTMFGAIYFLMPRLLFREWPSAALVRVHFWCASSGVVLLLACLFIGGWIQGTALNALTEEGVPVYKFLDVVGMTRFWHYGAACAWFVLSIGHIAFTINFFWMVVKRYGKQDDSGKPTLFAEQTA